MSRDKQPSNVVLLGDWRWRRMEHEPPVPEGIPERIPERWRPGVVGLVEDSGRSWRGFLVLFMADGLRELPDDVLVELAAKLDHRLTSRGL